MKVRCRNSHLELKHAHAGTHFVTNLHWTFQVQRRPRQDPLHVRGESFSSVQFDTRMRAARGMERKVVASWSTQSASKKPSAATWTPTPPTFPASRHSAEEVHVNPAFRMCGTGLLARTHTWQQKTVSSRPQKAAGNKPATGPELLKGHGATLR